MGNYKKIIGVSDEMTITREIFDYNPSIKEQVNTAKCDILKEFALHNIDKSRVKFED